MLQINTISLKDDSMCANLNLRHNYNRSVAAVWNFTRSTVDVRLEC